MDVFVILLLTLLLIYFFRRYLVYRSYVKHLADTLKVRQSYLFENENSPGKSKHMVRLTKRINTLILENTEIKQAQTSHMEQLEATLGNMLEGVVVLDGSNRILMANKALKSSFSDWIGDQEIVGQRLETLFSNSQLLKIIDQIKAGAASEPTEIEFINTGDHRWLRVSGARAKSGSPNTDDLILLVFYEITRRKKLETIRREFVANVSHELRTPVTIIKGYADTLSEDFDTMSEENRKKFLGKIKKNADRMHDLLTDLLSLAKIESSGPDFPAESIKLNALIRRVLANFFDRISDHGMKIKLELSENEISVWADPSKLEQVMENLLSNATKYTPLNSTLKIGTQKNENEVSIWVEDNGTGIPEPDLGRIFERFYRVEKGRSRDKGGTGLGLSIVKRIVSLHKGSVRAENVKGGGLRISITLPESKK
jgi:two-component system, OmpR family, phosphate regulon sensor histidine kinase PhoR